MIVRTENKDPSNLLAMVFSFHAFLVIFKSSQCERMKKETDTKTR